MSLRINTTDVGHTAECRALLDSLDDSTFVSLGVLFGTDLCVLGGTGHPTCWEALKSAWHQLDQKKREQLARPVGNGSVQGGVLRSSHDL